MLEPGELKTRLDSSPPSPELDMLAPDCLSSVYHPQTNGQSDRDNQDHKLAISLVSACHVASWSLDLPWVKYSHNSLICSSTGMSSFMVDYGYQPRLFPSQGQEVAFTSVPRAHHHSVIWRNTRSTLYHGAKHNRPLADRTIFPTRLIPRS